MSDDQSVKAPTAFIITETTESVANEDAQMEDSSSAEHQLPDRLRQRLQSERKCRPTNEQLDLKLARAEQMRQKQFAKRAANAREADARCRRVAEAMEVLHARRPESRAQVMQRFVRLQRDLQGVLGRFNSEVERTNCALFAGAPLLAFGAVAVSDHLHQSQFSNSSKRKGTAFVVAQQPGAETSSAAAEAAAAAEMPARLRQRLAAYPRRRSRHELKVALEKKLADAQRRKERYERRRAEAIKETEERCRRISETMEEINLTEAAGVDGGVATAAAAAGNSSPAAAAAAANGGSGIGGGGGEFYRRVAKLQVDLDCMFTKFNRELVTVRGRPIDLLETLSAKQQQMQAEAQRRSRMSSIGCQTEPQTCKSCGGDP